MNSGRSVLQHILVAVVVAVLWSPPSAADPEPAWANGFSKLPEPERVEALEALWRGLRFSACAEEQVAPLLAATADASHRVRTVAIRCLAQCGETSHAEAIAARWGQMFDDPDELRDVRRTLIGAMATLGVADAATLDRLVDLASATDDRVFSQQAVASLGALGVATDATLRVVLAHLEAGPRSPRVTALVALRSMTESLLARDAATVERVITAVRQHLPAPDVDVNQQAALFLGSLGQAAAPAVPTLIEMFRQRPFCRTQAAYALGEIGAPAASAIPLLAEAVRDATGPEKATLIKTLERLRTAEPALGDEPSKDSAADPPPKSEPEENDTVEKSS